MPHALLIDDDVSNLGVLQEILTLEGVAFTAIVDSTRVEDAIPEMEPIDVVFLDLEMPDVDGYQMFQLLKSYPQFDNVPIAACTVHTAEFHTARELGFHSFISKPLDIDAFPHQLAEILQGKSVWDVT